jgi:AraC-like DNA-binding protein
MIDLEAALQPIFAGVVVGAVAVLGGAVVRTRAAAGVRTAAVLCLAGVGVYGVASLPNIAGALAQRPLLGSAAAGLVCAIVGFYAVAVRAAFQDKSVKIIDFWPPAALTLLGLCALQARGRLRAGLILLFYGFDAALLIYVTCLTVRGGAGDLVEARRRLRGPAAALTLAFCLSSIVDIALSTAVRFGLLHGWMTLEREAVLAGLAVVAASLLLSVRSALAPAPRLSNAADPDVEIYDAVRRRMEADEAWREEGLSLAALCASLNTPEYRVRRVILTRFGARNFPAFVNAYRIEAAKARLASRDAEQTTVAGIAFEVGFSSLTAFNRAFKEAAGEPPTSWRRRARRDAA